MFNFEEWHKYSHGDVDIHAGRLQTFGDGYAEAR